MGGKINIAALFLVLAANLLQTTYGRTYTVGDSTGWGIPTTNTDFYDDWADNKAFVVGDVLVFNFTTAQHDVAEVTEAAYDACNATDTISTVSNGPARITLNRSGEHYFVCGVPGHCSAGQKLNVEVRNGTRNSTAPTPRPSRTTPGAPSPSPSPTILPPTSSPTSAPGAPSATSPGTSSSPRDNAASTLVATLSLVFFVSVALALLC